VVKNYIGKLFNKDRQQTKMCKEPMLPKLIKRINILLGQTTHLWLNSKNTPHDWLKNIDTNSDSGSLVIDEDLANTVVQKNECIGLIVEKDELKGQLAAKITSWDCNSKASFACTLDASHFTKPSQRMKFPCIPQKNETRKRRAAKGNKQNGKIFGNLVLHILKNIFL
jgi:hypothetical protein